MASPLEMDIALRRLLEDYQLPAPDRIEHQPDGTVLALWDDQKLAVVVEPGDEPH
jgi:hypothetical protein